VRAVIFVDFPWTRRLSQPERHSAAQRLADRLKALQETQSNIVVIGHSHGGNVAIQAIQLAGLHGIRVVTLGTPFLRIEDRSFPQRSRRMIATIVVFLWAFLALGPAIFLFFAWGLYWPLSGYNGASVLYLILWVGAWMGIFPAIIFSHARWLPHTQRWLERSVAGRRGAYDCAELRRRIEMLVIYHEAYDEADIALRLIRTRNIKAASSFLKTQDRMDKVEFTLRSWRYPTICLGLALAVLIGPRWVVQVEC